MPTLNIQTSNIEEKKSVTWKHIKDRNAPSEMKFTLCGIRSFKITAVKYTWNRLIISPNFRGDNFQIRVRSQTTFTRRVG